MAKTGAKTSASVLVPLAALFPFDLWWLVVIPLGVFFGAAMRIAGMVSKQRVWGDIRRDICASILAGGGNGIIAAGIIQWADLNLLQGMGVAFACAFLGFSPGDKLARWLLPGGGIGRIVDAIRWVMKNSDRPK